MSSAPYKISNQHLLANYATIEGDGNTITGHNNIIIGNQNIVNGDNNQVCGNHNNLTGNNNRWTGTDNRATNPVVVAEGHGSVFNPNFGQVLQSTMPIS